MLHIKRTAEEEVRRFEGRTRVDAFKGSGLAMSRNGRVVIVMVALAVVSSAVAWAESPIKKPKRTPEPVPLEDPRGEPDLTVCSQNLKLFGSLSLIRGRTSAMGVNQYLTRVKSLVQRFVKARCDVIAVQEVLGASQDAAKASLEELARGLQRATNRIFEAAVAPPGEGAMTVGFLVARDRAEIANTVSYAKVELPKLVPKQKTRLFPRTPLEVQLTVRSKGTDLSKTVTIVNFHFKSKRGGADDPTGLEWETYRMEMAEALRRITERRHTAAFASAESILMLVGDRNSNFDVASARILEGTLALSRFQNEAPCRLSKRGLPLCKAGQYLPQRLFSVLTRNPETQNLPGTFTYKSEYSWLDEILLPAESLPLAWSTAVSEGVYSSGVLYEPRDASDHALVWVRLNWG